MAKRVFVIGVQPPPVHGLSAMNRAVLHLIRLRNADAVSIDLSCDTASRIRFGALRLWRFSTGLLRYIGSATRHPGSATYIALSGGLGQVFDSFFLIAARMCRSRIFLHHHSFAYLDQHKMLTSALVFFASPEATHIVLGEDMRSKLHARYGANIRAKVVSNAAILPLEIAETAHRRRVVTVGFLSNITTAKGIDEMFEVADAVGATKPQLRFAIAGPITEPALQERFQSRLNQSKNVTWVGPVYGAHKVHFLSNMDILLFPTKYKNEAEPLTIYEALGSATPVIANARGCIASMVPRGGGLVVNDPNDFVQAASTQICRWVDSPEEFTRASECAREKFLFLRAAQQSAVTQFLDQLCGGTIRS